MASISLPPFLDKLRIIAKTVPPEVAGWSEDGKQFLIHSNRFEKEVLAKHFRGSRQTFIRQLHFYCFKKLDNKGERWAFFHPKFQRDSPHLIYEIKRKTRTENGGPASKLEVQSVRAEMDNLRKKMQKEIDVLKKHLESVLEDVQKQKRKCKCGLKRERKNSPDVVSEASNSKKRKTTKEESVFDWEYPDVTDVKLLSTTIPFDDGSLALFGDDIMRLEDPITESKSTEPIVPYMDEQILLPESHADISVSANINEPPFVSGSAFFASVATLSGIEKSGETVEKVLMYSRTGEALNFGVQALAGFLNKFVEKVRLLSSQNLLHNFDAFQDKDLMRSVQAKYPEGCPLRSLVDNSSPYVRRVLLRVFEEVTFDASETMSFDIVRETSSTSFLDKPLLVFKLPGGVARDVKGKSFLTYLSFLLEASLMPVSVVRKSKITQKQNVFGVFSDYFTGEMKNVLLIAHSNLAKMKVCS